MVEPEWKPISSAPKDGTHILLCRKPHHALNRQVFIGRWMVDKVGGEHWSINRDSKNPGAAQDDDLMGWMPLPSPSPYLC